MQVLSLRDSTSNRDSQAAAISSAPNTGQSASGIHRSGRLGNREREILEIVWADGSGTVQQVSRRLPISLAYTTVMTTLDRLFKKGLLHRVKRDRAFLYSPAASPMEVDSLRARVLIDHFFEGKGSNADMLLSCLVDVIGRYDDKMLHLLEDKLRAAKLQLEARNSKGQEPIHDQRDRRS